MSKLFFKLFVLASIAVVLQGCQKQPLASFKTDLEEYMVGQTINITNTSIDAESYEWTFPNGETSTEKSINYIIPQNSNLGVQSILLKAYSKNKKKVDTKTTFINVKTAQTGTATFWLYVTASGTSATVTVQNVSKSIYTCFTSQPSCQNPNCANFTLSPGTYQYYASGSGIFWNGTFTVTAGGCELIELN
jgi:hypothetical protein